jgi:ABC-2 type transport system permease protein
MQGKKSNLTKIAVTKLFEHGLSKMIFAVSLLIMLFLTNYILAIKTSYIDITKNQIYTLSDQTKEFLDRIDYRVDIKAFYLLKNQYRVKRLLDLYVQENDNIHVEIIDPLENPVVAEKYKIGDQVNTIVFEAPNKSTRLRPPRPGAHNAEPEITTAFYRLITDDIRTLYFTEGHGEMILESTAQNGLSLLYDSLTKQNFVVESINLQTVSAIPSDCDVLIFIGPKTQFSKEELAVIQGYREKGGNFLLTTLAGSDPGIGYITSVNSVSFGYDFVYETASDKTTQLGPTFPICNIFEPSEITENLQNQNFMFPFTSSVHIMGAGPEDIMTNLIATSENSWAESIDSLPDMEKGNMPSWDENELKGPIVVAVTNESKILIPDPDTPGQISEHTVRSAFFGSSGIVTNSIASKYPGNLSLFVNTVNWITRNENAFELNTHFVEFTPVELTKKQQRLISLLSLFVFPATILIIGLFVWIRKR